jgi:hypothetical protein
VRLQLRAPMKRGRDDSKDRILPEDALPENPEDLARWQEKVAYNSRPPPVWQCARCGCDNDDVVFSMQCLECEKDRFPCVEYSGREFWITRTVLDHKNDCTHMNRIAFAQLLIPPRVGQQLMGVLVSGLGVFACLLFVWLFAFTNHLHIVFHYDLFVEFAKANIPPTVRLWAVLHDCDSQAEVNTIKYHNNVGGNRLWKARQWKPKAIGSMHVK